MYAPMHTFVCESMCVWVYMHIYTCLETEADLRCSSCSLIWFLRQFSLGPGTWWLGWPEGLRDLLVSAYPALGLQECATTPSLLCGWWGLNSSPCACVARSLPPEPSSLPFLWFLHHLSIATFIPLTIKLNCVDQYGRHWRQGCCLKPCLLGMLFLLCTLLSTAKLLLLRTEPSCRLFQEAFIPSRLPKDMLLLCFSQMRYASRFCHSYFEFSLSRQRNFLSLGPRWALTLIIARLLQKDKTNRMHASGCEEVGVHMERSFRDVF